MASAAAARLAAAQPVPLLPLRAPRSTVAELPVHNIKPFSPTGQVEACTATIREARTSSE